MRRLTESAAGLVLLVVTLGLAAAGLILDLLDQGDPPSFFGAAAVAAVAATTVALDQHRREGGRYRGAEALFGRALIVLALALGAVSFALALGASPYRNLWLVLAIVVDLDALAVVVDSHRLVAARIGGLATRPHTDALAGALAAAMSLGLGVVGLIAGLVDNPHAPAWLHAGVVLALVSVAFMFDEQAHVTAHLRQGPKRLGGSPPTLSSSQSPDPPK